MRLDLLSYFTSAIVCAAAPPLFAARCLCVYCAYYPHDDNCAVCLFPLCRADRVRGARDKDSTQLHRRRRKRRSLRRRIYRRRSHRQGEDVCRFERHLHQSRLGRPKAPAAQRRAARPQTQIFSSASPCRALGVGIALRPFERTAYSSSRRPPRDRSQTACRQFCVFDGDILAFAAKMRLRNSRRRRETRQTLRIDLAVLRKRARLRASLSVCGKEGKGLKSRLSRRVPPFRDYTHLSYNCPQVVKTDIDISARALYN